jgi:hypothetical protein
LIQSLLPDGRLSSRARRIWTAFLLLAPAALVAGMALMVRADPRSELGLTLDRDAAIAAARRLAQSQGVDASTWVASVVPDTNTERSFYHRLPPTEERLRVRQVWPELTIIVTLRSPDRTHGFVAVLGPDGRPLGFTQRFARTVTPPADVGEDRDRAVAEKLARDWAALSGLTLGSVSTDQETENGAEVREFTWPVKTPSLPELSLELKIRTRAATVIEHEVEGSIDDAFSRASLGTPPSWLTLTFGITIGLFYVWLIVAAFYRYILRAKQKEAPHARALMISAVMVAATLTVVVLTDALGREIGQSIFEAILLFFFASLTFVVIGAAVGIAWGSGEGDIRELFPGRMTSLDALITGRLLSIEIARSILVGTAFAGWLLLVHGMVLLPLRGRPDAGIGSVGVRELLTPSVGLTHFLDAIATSVNGGAFLLLVALPILRRFFKSNRAFYAAVALTAFVFASAQEAGYRPVLVAMLLTAMTAAALVVPFFTHDLLSAIAAYAAFDLFAGLSETLNQPMPRIRADVMATLAIAIAALIAECVMLVRGRTYTEEEVRPVYAAHLAERISLQTEASAAREAQLRLLPRKLPDVAGLSISASCRAAHEVGGDFYDVYRVDESRIAIFVADGGGRGMDAALVIALAKGFLMPTARQNLPPSELMTRLYRRIAPFVGDSTDGGAMYAVVDVAAGRLTYARTGTSPFVLVGAAGNGQVTAPAERVVTPGGEIGLTLIEGTWETSPGHSIFIMTDGINGILEAAGAPTVGEWIARTTAPLKPGATSAHEALTREITRYERSARRRGKDDDITTVVIHLEPMTATVGAA